MTLKNIKDFFSEKSTENKQQNEDPTDIINSPYSSGGRYVHKWFVSVGEFHSIANELGKAVSTADNRMFFTIEEYAVEIEISTRGNFFSFHDK